MPLALSIFLVLLASLLSGVLGALVAGLWYRRRPRAGGPIDPDCQHQLEALARAREASERANAELRRALDQLERTAATDRLTGAWNRRWLEDGAAQLIAAAGRGDAPISLILYDLDHFKRVNDSFGHEVGDEVLKSVTEAVRGQLRASDALARWGGEEFIALCPATTLAGATILAEKIRQAVEARVTPKVGVVTISLGVAQRQEKEPLEGWIRRADEALYRAKARGRNQTEASLEVGVAAGEDRPSFLALVWDPALACGEAVIDHQHQELYRLSNALLASINQGRYPEETKLHMQLLIAHVAQHFHDEEAILIRVGYPEFAAHAQEHGRLLAKAKVLQQQMGGDSTDLPAILGFLALDLVKGHILGSDRDFYKYLAQD
ncbi:diguanylate cyclase [Geothrix alkalitolerans]|uniref:diguanylate cyclase n=1 Tax=Geothrix alkalitolerans TaxID=2922724 RepID=UPI001FAF34E2|nr:diguanylate cyclase [Geothrix alkalitolerans]